LALVLTSLWQSVIITDVRTTLNLDDDVLELAKQYADSRSVALGKAVSELVRRGVRSRVPTRIVNGFHVVDLPPDSPIVTTELVSKLEAESE
jgi:hypothetical protein